MTMDSPGLASGVVVGAVFLVASAAIATVLLRVESPQAHGDEFGAPAAETD